MKLTDIFGTLLISLCVGCASRPPHQPVTLTYLDVEWDTPDNMPSLAEDLKDFTDETGIRVRRLPRPDGSLNQLALWRELLQKGASSPDVASIDVIWSGMLSPYLLDLRPYLADELSTQDPVVLASYTANARVVAVPHHAYVGVLFYRPDLLRRYGYREPRRVGNNSKRWRSAFSSANAPEGTKTFGALYGKEGWTKI